MFLPPVYPVPKMEQEVWDRLLQELETHKESLLDKTVCSVETYDLEFPVKPKSPVAQLSLKKFHCRVQVWRRR